MADDEQFSLCWNNFNSNLSAGFHESLCRGDLVDVTLAAEGQFVKAHRLVLSVCSPFFRRMFSHMPANQHAFVFLKDVSHAALKDLIQFMYCGEVNVKQDALPAFISTAESLQIKGLTDGEPGPVQSPIKSSTPAPQQTACVNLISNVPRQKPSKCLPKYKIETDDSDDKGEQVAVPAQTGMKRQTQRTSTSQSSSAIKKLKSGDTLESISSPQIPLPAEDGKTTRQEFIDLPLDVSTKVEPDYTSDARETSEQETYVEDDSYGDMKYDENYFTENEETGVNATNTFKQSGSFSETYITESGDQTTNETQGREVDEEVAINNPNMIPLHAGCKTLVSKMDLIKIYTSNAALYSSRLMEAVFSAEELNAKKLRTHEHLESLDKERICSIITHVVQVFSARGKTITEQMVKKFLGDKLSRGRIAFE